jgi:hypothetical protein
MDHRRVVGRDEIGQHFRTAGRRPALGTKDILLGDGNAGQRAGRTGCDAGIGGTRHGQRLLAVDGDEGVDIGIQALDAVEEQRGQLDAGNLLGGQGLRQFFQAC